MAKAKILKSHELELIKNTTNEDIKIWNIQIALFHKEINDLKNHKDTDQRIDQIWTQLNRHEAWIEASRGILVKLEQYAVEIEI